MKPKNFPGRKNKRRQRAVDRFNGTTQNAKMGYENTRNKILPQQEAESIRTKKFRG
jgi:hypothetical protein